MITKFFVPGHLFRPSLLFYLSVLFLTTKALPQQDTLISFDEPGEEFLESLSGEIEEPLLAEIIEELRDNPVSLNDAAPDELLSVPFLDYAVVKGIINYRKRNGRFFSINELRNIEGFNPRLLMFIRQFLTVDKIERIKNPEEKSAPFNLIYRTRIKQDLQPEYGYLNGNYSGSRVKFYSRLQMNYAGKIESCLLFEKDAGEKSLTDFRSFNVTVKDFSLFDQVIIGDYLMEFGHGLVMWSPWTFGKTVETPALMRNGRGLVPYKSADEEKFLRGIAISATEGPLSYELFYSNNNRDAIINEAGVITSLPESGYHRTETESSRKDNSSLSTWGMSVSYLPFENFRFSILYYKNRLDRINNYPSDYLSAYSELRLGKGKFSLEAAKNNNKTALQGNIELNLLKNLAVISSVRNYPEDYYAPFSGAWGERSNTSGERGFLTGFRLNTVYGSISGYYDIFSFPSGFSEGEFSRSGNDLNISFRSAKFGPIRFNLKFSSETKEEDITEENNFRLVKITSAKTRGEIIFLPGKNIALKTRIEYRQVSKPLNEKGILLFQDFKMTPVNNIVVRGRFIYFQTDSFNSAIYEFESAPAGDMYNPALFGNGMRWYLLIKYKISTSLHAGFKYSETIKPGEKSIGSGLQKINGNIDNNLSFQIDFAY